MTSSTADLIEQGPHLEARAPEPIHCVTTIKAGGRTFARCGCGHVWEVLPGGSLACAVDDIWADFADDLKRITLDRDRRLANRRLLKQIDQIQLRLAAGGSL